MNLKAALAFLLSAFFVADVCRGSEADASFFDVDDDVRRFQRNLLQAEEEKESTEAPVKHSTTTTEAPKKKGKFVHGEYSLGNIFDRFILQRVKPSCESLKTGSFNAHHVHYNRLFVGSKIKLSFLSELHLGLACVKSSYTYRLKEQCR